MNPAYYDSNYHAFFVRTDALKNPGILLFIGFHENLHGYVNLSNPKVSQAGNIGDVTEFRTGPSSVTPAQLEESLVYISIDEGFAHWGSLRTARSLKGVFTHDDFLAFDYPIAYARKSGENASNHKKRIITRFGQDVRDLMITLPEGSLAASLRAIDLVRDIDQIQTVVGYNFVDSFMGTLENRGMMINAAIDWLIKNPPSTVSELINPTHYARKAFS